VAQNVAEALDYAHRQGVIHRDIKPANVLMLDGKPVVSDFGIALAVGAAGGGRLTETGLSLGTPHYMSPEQATGDLHVGPAADVYALGCVLYEMLVGDPPHVASTPQAILGKIITEPPPAVTKARKTVPTNVEAAIARALEKVPADRFRSAADLGNALDDEKFRHGEHGGAKRAGKIGHWHGPMLAMTTAATLATVVATWAVLRLASAHDDDFAIRTEITLDHVAGIGVPVRISPDGRWVVTRRAVEGPDSVHLHIRSIDDAEWRLLPNTEGGADPSFSPSGDWLAFEAGDNILKTPTTGGPSILVAADGHSPHWGKTDEIVFRRRQAIYRVGPSGGEPRLLLEEGMGARPPHLLPNGKGVVFSTGTGGDPLNARVLLLEIETGEVRELLSSGNDPRYLPTGHLIYGHGSGALMGIEFDLRTLQTRGEPVMLVPGLYVPPLGGSHFTVSDNGILLYRARTGGASNLLSWVDLGGVHTAIPIGGNDVHTPRVSPDGNRVAYRSGNHLFIWDEAAGTNRQLTFEGTNVSPVWSPDGSYIYFLSERPGTDGFDGFRRAVDGSSGTEQLWTAEGEAAITSASPDGRWLVVGDGTVAMRGDLSLAVLDTDSVSLREYLRSDLGENEGVVSPDGRWLAYWGETGPNESGIFVRGFPEPIGLWRVSASGHDPVWAPDGSAIYYLTGFPGGGDLHRVEVSTEGSFSPGRSVRLFDSPFGHESARDRGYDVHPDGDRFVMAGRAGGMGAMFLVANWFTELEERMRN
jgi:serine/threonine-protein kinase